jgi:hypothetical protein
MKFDILRCLPLFVSAMTFCTVFAHAEIRPAPDRPLVVSTASLSAVFDPSDGLPYQFRLGKERIWGEDSGLRMTAILCRLEPRSYVTTEITPTATKVS